MKTQRYTIFSCLLLISAIVVSFGVALADANAGFGKTITTAQMANMFGGGFVLCGDKDCDTQSGSCPGDDTCDGEDDVSDCRDCQSGPGKKCGEPAGWGWQCVDTTESCNGEVGYCVRGSCERRAGTTSDSCGTRPDC